MESGKNVYGCDFMAIGAHPDDIEISMGGTLLKLRARGRTGILVDLTDGAMGTRGDVATRAREAAAAAERLGMERICLGLRDGDLRDDLEHQVPLVEAIRKYRPKVLITHYWEDEHPDHMRASRLVKEAWFKAGLRRLPSQGEAFRPGRLFFFIGNVAVQPSFCVDISDFYEAKLELLACYGSQIHGPDAGKYEGKTELSSPAFLEYLHNRQRHFGQQIRRKFAEGFAIRELPEVDDITELGMGRFA